MSAWSEWKCGAISYDDYKYACRMEAAREEMMDEEECEETGDEDDD